MKLEEILLSDNIVESINENLEYILEIIPELKPTIGFEHKHPHHHLDVWEHTLYALSLSEKDKDIRLTLLLHDIGKPFSYQEDGNIRHFKGHPEKSKEIAEKVLKRLGYEDEYIRKIAYLIKNHDRKITKSQILDNYELTKKLYKIQYCDALAHHPEKLAKRKEYLKETEEKIKELKLIKKKEEIL